MHFFEGKARSLAEIAEIVRLPERKLELMLDRAGGDINSVESSLLSGQLTTPFGRRIKVCLDGENIKYARVREIADDLGVSRNTMFQRFIRYGYDDDLTYWPGKIPHMRSNNTDAHRKRLPSKIPLKHKAESLLVEECVTLIFHIIKDAKTEVEKNGDEQAAMFLLNSGNLLYWYLEAIPSTFYLSEYQVEFDPEAAVEALAAFVYEKMPKMSEVARIIPEPCQTTPEKSLA